MNEPVRKDLSVVIDVGNTNTVFGLYRDGELVESLRLSTDRRRTADEYLGLLRPLFERARLDPERAEGVVVSSVVPPLRRTLDELCRRFFRTPPTFVDAFTDTGMAVRYDHPEEVGADRIVNALAARQSYGAPAVVVDFGTATTFDIVDAGGDYIGGLIAPGIAISAEALFAHASRLHRVDVRQPDHLIGADTAAALQAGIYYGYVGLVDGILARLKAEVAGLQGIVATGGLAELIARGSQHIRHVDQLLTLTGLKLIYDRLRR